MMHDKPKQKPDSKNPVSDKKPAKAPPGGLKAPPIAPQRAPERTKASQAKPVPAPPPGDAPKRVRGPDKAPRRLRTDKASPPEVTPPAVEQLPGAALPPGAGLPPGAAPGAPPSPAVPPAAPGPPPLTPERRAELAAMGIAGLFDTLTGFLPPPFSKNEKDALVDVWRPFCLAYGDQWFSHPVVPALLATVGMLSWRMKDAIVRARQARALPAPR